MFKSQNLFFFFSKIWVIKFIVREYKLFKKRKCPGWFLAFKAWARQSKAKTGRAIFSELSRATRIKSGIHIAMVNLSELGFLFF